MVIPFQMMKSSSRSKRTRLLSFPLACYFFSFLPAYSYMVHGFTPPHPDAFPRGEWETVDDYRRRQNIEYKYRPSSIHPEFCRQASEDKCKDMDEQFRRHAEQNRNLVVGGNKQFRLLVILVQWTNHANRTLIPPLDIDELWNSEGRSTTVAPSGSIGSYIRINSYDKFGIQADIAPWIMTDNTESYYAAGVSGIPPITDIRPAFTPILNKLDEAGLNWTDYDQDNNGVIDLLVVLHSGYGAEYGGNDCETGQPFSNRIWTSSVGPEPGGWRSSRENIQLGGYVIASAYNGICGLQINKIGLIARELLHSFGLMYLNDIQGPINLNGGVGGDGAYDIMSNPWGQGDASYPTHLSPWSKMRLGWLIPTQINYSGRYWAEASEVSDQVYLIRHGYTHGEYLLIENRQPILFDSLLWQPGGILIWHIDDNVDRAFEGNWNAGYPGQKGWPENGKHYQVALLQADSLYELEQAYDNGDTSDFWRKGTGDLGPGTRSSPSGNVIYPNTDGYAFGTIVHTGITISNFSVSDLVMSFDVHGLPEGPPTLPPIKNIIPIPTTSPTGGSMINASSPPTISNYTTTRSPTMSNMTVSSSSVAPSMVPSSSLNLNGSLSWMPSDSPSMVPSYAKNGSLYAGNGITNKSALSVIADPHGGLLFSYDEEKSSWSSSSSSSISPNHLPSSSPQVSTSVTEWGTLHTAWMTNHTTYTSNPSDGSGGSDGSSSKSSSGHTATSSAPPVHEGVVITGIPASRPQSTTTSLSSSSSSSSSPSSSFTLLPRRTMTILSLLLPCLVWISLLR